MSGQWCIYGLTRACWPIKLLSLLEYKLKMTILPKQLENTRDAKLAILTLDINEQKLDIPLCASFKLPNLDCYQINGIKEKCWASWNLFAQ